MKLKQGTFVLIFFFVFRIAYANSQISYQVLDKKNHLIHVLKFDPRQFDIKLVQADEKTSYQAPLSDLARSNDAILAINAGFFGLDKQKNAFPTGIVKINHQWLSGSKYPRAVLGWNQHSALIDNVIVKKHPKHVQVKPMRTSVKQWELMTDAIGGVPLLVYNGKIIRNYEHEKITRKDFIDEPHARTAVGITAQGNWIIAVAEQRYQLKDNATDLDLFQDYMKQANVDAKKIVRERMQIAIKGLTLSELAEVMKAQGSRWAINLDGGGSSGLYYQGEMKTRHLEDHLLLSLAMQRHVNTAIIVKSN